MATEKQISIPSPDQFIHPRQKYLWRRLQANNLPEGAEELLKEAINEYQAAFKWKAMGVRAVNISSSMVNTALVVSMDEDGPNNILAGKNHLLTVRFGLGMPKTEPVIDPFVFIATSVSLRNMPGVEILPDWLRYIGVDISGHSHNAGFLLQVPDTLKGYNGGIEIRSFNGTTCVAEVISDLNIV